jgi:PAS domain-containing protein
VSGTGEPRPALRETLCEAFGRSPAEFRDRLGDHDVQPATADRLATTPGSADLPLPDDRPDRERTLVWQAWTLDDCPLGVTVAGPAYHDTPVVYATPTVRSLTGYSLAALRGENLRLLQGPATDERAVDELRGALRRWEPTTVDLVNYRRDGTPFCNRLSLVPVPAADGTVENWVGLQRAIRVGETTGADGVE